MSYPDWKNSPEYDEWVESGERDEDFSDYYNQWNRNAEKEFYRDKN